MNLNDTFLQVDGPPMHFTQYIYIIYTAYRHLLQKSAFKLSGVKKGFDFNFGAEGIVIIPRSVVLTEKIDCHVSISK
jgi:hypothetical protein